MSKQVKQLLLALLMVATAGGAATILSAQDAALIIGNDRGGPIGARAIEVAHINTAHIRVELRGRICYSSCTLYLGADDVCVGRDTSFGFHGPSRHGQTLPPAEFDHWSRVMAAHYSEPLRDWFWRQARFSVIGYYRISGAQLVALGYSPC